MGKVNPNYGVLIEEDNEGDETGVTVCYSSDSTDDVDWRPKLTITYTPAAGGAVCYAKQVGGNRFGWQFAPLRR